MLPATYRQRLRIEQPSRHEHRENIMNLRIIVWAGLVSILIGASSASADNLRDKLFGNKIPNCIAARQCDDYCRKSIPCTRPTRARQSNDYCPKRLPCTQPTRRRQCDDYCPKSVPRVCANQCAASRPCQICQGQCIGKPSRVTTARIATARVATQPGEFLVVDPVRK